MVVDSPFHRLVFNHPVNPVTFAVLLIVGKFIKNVKTDQ
jgi:hypothetical protein